MTNNTIKQAPEPTSAADGAAESSSGATQAPQQDAPDNRIAMRMLAILLILAVIYTLEIAKTFLVPVALAFLLSLALDPVVRWLARFRLPRSLGAGLTVITLLSTAGYGLASSVNPVSNWLKEAPQLLHRLEYEFYPIKKTVEDVDKTAEEVDKLASVGSDRGLKIKTFSFREALYSNARALVTGTIMTTLLLYFFLSWGQRLLIRISELMGRRGRRNFLELATVLEGEVSKYLFTITLINFGLGSLVGMVLFAFGMPNPILWGATAAVLNYVPYVGPLVTVVLLGATALLTFDGLTLPALVVGAFGLLTILEGHIVTPLILGRQLALNPLVVFLSIIFWFWLWNVMGALMAVPILITLKLIGDRIAPMRSVSIIVGR